eukprot:4074852-Amphidinium_carterae.1
MIVCSRTPHRYANIKLLQRSACAAARANVCRLIERLASAPLHQLREELPPIASCALALSQLMLPGKNNG